MEKDNISVQIYLNKYSLSIYHLSQCILHTIAGGWNQSQLTCFICPTEKNFKNVKYGGKNGVCQIPSAL